jgi:hypothetical protein
MPVRLKPTAFILEQPQLLLFALLATMSSGFGQTFFISLFGGEIRAAFELTHTTYGTLYATATVCSALLLVRIGPVIDIWPLQRVALFTVLIVTAGCLFMGFWLFVPACKIHCILQVLKTMFRGDQARDPGPGHFGRYAGVGA